MTVRLPAAQIIGRKRGKGLIEVVFAQALQSLSSICVHGKNFSLSVLAEFGKMDCTPQRRPIGRQLAKQYPFSFYTHYGRKIREWLRTGIIIEFLALSNRKRNLIPAS